MQGLFAHGGASQSAATRSPETRKIEVNLLEGLGNGLRSNGLRRPYGSPATAPGGLRGNEFVGCQGLALKDGEVVPACYQRQYRAEESSTMAGVIERARDEGIIHSRTGHAAGFLRHQGCRRSPEGERAVLERQLRQRFGLLAPEVAVTAEPSICARFGRDPWVRWRAWILVFSSVEMTNSSSRRGIPFQPGPKT